MKRCVEEVTECDMEGNESFSGGAAELHKLTQGDFQSLHLASDLPADSLLKLWTVAGAEPLHSNSHLQVLFLATRVEENKRRLRCNNNNEKKTLRGLTLSERLQLQGGAIGAVVYRRR